MYKDGNQFQLTALSNFRKHSQHMWINGQLNEIQLVLSNHGTTRISIFLLWATIPVPQQNIMQSLLDF